MNGVYGPGVCPNENLLDYAFYVGLILEIRCLEKEDKTMCPFFQEKKKKKNGILNPHATCSIINLRLTKVD